MNSDEKNKGRINGAPNVVVDDAFLKKVEEAAAKGGGYGDIARTMGIGESTLRKHRKKAKALEEAIANGRAKAVRLVEDALFQDALTPGNTVAKIWWLKNRAPERWKDRHEVEAKVNVSLAEDLEEVHKKKAELQLKRQQDNTGGETGQVSVYVRH